MRIFRRPARLLFQIIGILTVIGLCVVVVTLPLLPRILQVEDELRKADYILPLSGDWHRLIKAAKLYKAGYAPKVVLSNYRVPKPTRVNEIRKAMGFEVLPEYEFRRRLIVHLGVDEDALTSFGKGHISTAEEAEAFQKFLGEQDAGSSTVEKKRVILVTSPYHSRRTKMIFEAAMPEAIFMMTSPPEGRIKPQWWRDQNSAQLAVSETFKFMFYLVGGRFRAQPEIP